MSAVRGMEEDPDTGIVGNETTVMLRNLPNNYTSAMLLKVLDGHGFRGLYDFAYLPMDFQNDVNLGYALVNLLSYADAHRLVFSLKGFSMWSTISDKVCETSFSRPIQGLSPLIERYRNSPVMHPCVPDDYKPRIFRDGIRAPFPAPTKPTKAPKHRPARKCLPSDGKISEAARMYDSESGCMANHVSVCA